MKNFSWSNFCGMHVYFSDEQLIRAWKELPEKERLTLYLIDVEQLSWKKVVAILRIPAATVTKQVAWARAELKRKLSSFGRSGDSPEKKK